MDKGTVSELLEEGEIIDDDDLEDISDNSIIESTFGKFSTPYENLCAVSLSSDSDIEIAKITKCKKKLLNRKTRIKHKKPRKTSESSDEEGMPPKDLKNKLKEAIHISGTEGGRKNTLQARLKAMGGISSDNPASSEPLSTEANDNMITSDKADDTELEVLRLEALKTAIINKTKKRKRKKALQEAQVEGHQPVQRQENKENDTPTVETANSNNDKLKSNVIVDFDEDEDLLRASLLAGLAKKMTNVHVSSDMVKPVTTKLPVKVVPVLPKKTVVKNTVINKNLLQNRIKTLVKPLIINVNGDSDSDVGDEIKPELQTNSKVTKINNLNLEKPVAINVNRKSGNIRQNILKTRVKPLIITVSRDSDSETEQEVKTEPLDTVDKPNFKSIANNVDKFLKEQRAKFEKDKTKKNSLANKSQSILEKSAVKLLPKSQQLEYQQLLRMLKIAEKRKRRMIQLKQQAARKLKTNIPISTPLQSETSPLAIVPVPTVAPNVQALIQPETNAVSDINTDDNSIKSDFIADEAVSNSSNGQDENNRSDSETAKARVTSELTKLQKTLKEIKMQRNGSLQIKNKYQVLTPIIRKITETSNERKKQEQRIKVLQKELAEARKNLSRSHEKFSLLVKDLVAKKETIEKSCEEAKIKENIKKANVDNNKEVKTAPITSTPIKSIPEIDNTSISTIVTSSTNHGYEDMDVCNSDEEEECEIDIVDPNDIDQIFIRRAVVKPAIPEYVSPLNRNGCERYRNVDPLGIMCPYEVNGSCRDIDCTFKHYLKEHERQ